MSSRVSPEHWLYLALSVLCQVTAVVLGKTAALHMEVPSPVSFLTNPWYLAGLACLVLQALFWQLVLRGVRLFVAYLAASINYVLILLASRIFFQEALTLPRVVGTSLIATGVVLVIWEELS
jgi:multidrug transporter EmrE-like cation transporter